MYKITVTIPSLCSQWFFQKQCRLLNRHFLPRCSLCYPTEFTAVVSRKLEAFALGQHVSFGTIRPLYFDFNFRFCVPLKKMKTVGLMEKVVVFSWEYMKAMKIKNNNHNVVQWAEYICVPTCIQSLQELAMVYFRLPQCGCPLFPHFWKYPRKSDLFKLQMCRARFCLWHLLKLLFFSFKQSTFKRLSKSRLVLENRKVW